MTNVRITSGKATRPSWLITAIRKLQQVSEHLLLVGLAIALRKKLESCAIFPKADVDMKVDSQISSRSITHNLIVFFRPSSRI